MSTATLSVKEVISVPEDPAGRMKAFWRGFFKQDVNAKKLNKIKFDQDKHCGIFVPEGLEYHHLMSVARKFMGIKLYGLNDRFYEILSLNDVRKPNVKGAYFFLTALRVEDLRTMPDLSAKDCCDDGMLGITLMEMILFRMYQVWIYGFELDTEMDSICSGSTLPEGKVLITACDDQKEYHLEIGSVGNDYFDPGSIVREVIVP